MKIFIHIGWHKTGTTAIQSFLKKNNKKLLEENKLYYPSEGLVDCAHHNIAWALQEKDNFIRDGLSSTSVKSLIQQAIENGKKHGCQNLIFSSEEFCTFSEKEIGKLKEILNYDNHKIIIVAYVRRQDLLIESAYKMEVKWWGSRMTDGFQQYVKNKTPFIKYDVVLDTWAYAFGLENIKVRVYATDYKPQNDIRLDFCGVVGINSGNLLFDNNRINTSLGPKSLAILRVLNRLFIPKTLHKRIVSLLQKYEKSSEYALFDPQHRIEFMEVLNESNRNLEKFAVNPDLLILKNEKIIP